MTICILSARQFNQDVGKAKRAAVAGPVFITDRGEPAHVLLTFDAYKRITCGPAKIADLLAMPGVADVPFDVPQPRDAAQAADLS